MFIFKNLYKTSECISPLDLYECRSFIVHFHKSIQNVDVHVTQLREEHKLCASCLTLVLCQATIDVNDDSFWLVVNNFSAHHWKLCK